MAPNSPVLNPIENYRSIKICSLYQIKTHHVIYILRSKCLLNVQKLFLHVPDRIKNQYRIKTGEKKHEISDFWKCLMINPILHEKVNIQKKCELECFKK